MKVRTFLKIHIGRMIAEFLCGRTRTIAYVCARAQKRGEFFGDLRPVYRVRQRASGCVPVSVEVVGGFWEHRSTAGGLGGVHAGVRLWGQCRVVYFFCLI